MDQCYVFRALKNVTGDHMATVTDDKIREVAKKLWKLYEESFRGKDRGRFCLTREQLKRALDTKSLHASTIERLRDEAQILGLIVLDLDDRFPCVEERVVRRYRRPPSEVFGRYFPEPEDEDASEMDDDD
jgi:hypothetical protein